jgi:hypothetical protein
MEQQTPISAHVATADMIYFARMVDKIRKAAAGTLREDFVANLGRGFDARCAGFLRVDYAALQARVLEGGSDQEILAWCQAHGRTLDANDVHIWNEFLRKVGIDDGVTEILVRRKRDSGLEGRDEIRTMVDYFDYDEGRRA